MTFAFEFHPEAQAELVADVDWYDDRDPAVGSRFVEAIRAAIDSMVEDPAAWPILPGWDREPIVRSRGVSGFPYRVVYFVWDDVLTIVAVAHAKRRPGYWQSRVGL